MAVPRSLEQRDGFHAMCVLARKVRVAAEAENATVLQRAFKGWILDEDPFEAISKEAVEKAFHLFGRPAASSQASFSSSSPSSVSASSASSSAAAAVSLLSSSASAGSSGGAGGGGGAAAGSSEKGSVEINTMDFRAMMWNRGELTMR
jgi:hypothetical protein